MDNKSLFIEKLKAYLITPEINDLLAQLKAKFRLSTVFSLVEAFVVQVEKVAHDIDAVGSGSDKKAAVVQVLDEAIDLPFYIEWIDGKVIEIIIDSFVTIYNQKHGRNWIEKVLAIL